ncbi:E3 ubiquitin-protein ligase ZNRF1 [Lemmus lemmus]
MLKSCTPLPPPCSHIGKDIAAFVSRVAKDSLVRSEGFKCPICSKSVASDEMEMHFIMCLSKPRLSYNDDVLTKDAGECVICLEELLQGDTIARLPCLCIYHKRFILFIPSKCPDQLTVSGKSGIFALFTFTSNSDSKGRDKARVRMRQGTGPWLQNAGPNGPHGEADAPADQPALRGTRCCHREMEQQLSARWSTTDFLRPTQGQTALFLGGGSSDTGQS